MGDEIPDEANNVWSGQTSTYYDQKYIDKSLKEFALILYDYVIGEMENEKD